MASPTADCIVHGGKNRIAYTMTTSGWGTTYKKTMTLEITGPVRLSPPPLTFQGKSASDSGSVGTTLQGEYSAAVSVTNDHGGQANSACGPTFVCHEHCGRQPRTGSHFARLRATFYAARMRAYVQAS
jgi:hypothetical protein